MLQRQIRRYNAHYMGWCEAFGEHENINPDSEATQWLLGGDRIGLLMGADVRKVFNRLLLGHQNETLSLVLEENQLWLGREQLPLGPLDFNLAGVAPLLRLLQQENEVHMFLTYHFYYPSGSRIVTFSSRPPMALLYREMSSLSLRIGMFRDLPPE